MVMATADNKKDFKNDERDITGIDGAKDTSRNGARDLLLEMMHETSASPAVEVG